MPHVLIVDADAETRAALAELVAAEGFTVGTAADLRTARSQIGRLPPDLLLVDAELPDGSGLELLGGSAATESILVARDARVETAVEALRRGAADHLIRPVDPQRLKAILSRVPRTGDLKAEIATLRGELRRQGRYGALLGRSAPMQALYDQIERVAPSEATVFLVGEPGTGKELTARTLHALSRRRRQTFLAVHADAIAPNRIEGELFGQERGGANGDRPHAGCFERANGGTLFIDDITEVPLPLQAKVLRALDTGCFTRAGGQAEVCSDVRVIVATHREPEQAVTEKRLRGDLHERLSAFALVLPPLRERGDDLGLLAQHFLDQLNAAHGTHKRFGLPSPGSLATLPWSGNVGELKAAVEKAFAVADHSVQLVAASQRPAAPAAAAGAAPTTVTVPVGSSLDEADRRLILATLEQCGGVKKVAAQLLGVSLKTLYNRLEEYREQGIVPRSPPAARATARFPARSAP